MFRAVVCSLICLSVCSAFADDGLIYTFVINREMVTQAMIRRVKAYGNAHSNQPLLIRQTWTLPNTNYMMIRLTLKTTEQSAIALSTQSGVGYCTKVEKLVRFIDEKGRPDLSLDTIFERPLPADYGFDWSVMESTPQP